NKDKRRLTRSNHTATHLLHHALREILGTHVEQKGSLVNQDHLRFDFSHFSKVTAEEIQTIEKQVNDHIREGIALEEKRAVPKKVAEGMGAMALFGEKYGDLVRVIKFGESVELCGGIHVENTSEIGRFKIVSEGSVASGVRRIEAITSDAAEDFFNKVYSEFVSVSELLKKQDNLAEAINELLQKNNKQSKEIESLKKELAQGVKNGLKNQISDESGIKLLKAEVALGTAEIKDICFQLKNEFDNILIVLGGKDGDKASLTICISDDLAKQNEWHAGNLVREAAKHINGGGGGQPFFATAGGKNPSGIQAAINDVLAKTINNG
ncbi:MAG: DHHA1 domain-containing protein, partial [Crocinitomicaceae bacterium]|nr:DHHA1 domain-containing protein [Crocinitomicaceae bacterium]